MLTLFAVVASLLAACGADKPPEPTATPLPGTVLNRRARSKTSP